MTPRTRLLTALTAAALTATAAEESDSLRVGELREMTFTGTVTETATVPAQTLEGEALRKLSAQSVADAVRYFSGVQIKDFGGVGGLKTVDIRSMGSHHLGVFYDGIEIGNAQNGTVDLGKFSMENLESVSLYNGQKSEIFQPAKDFGSAGTLYLRTRRPRFEAGKKYNLTLGMKAGSFGLANPSVLYERKLGGNVHLSASAEYTYATGRYHFRYSKRTVDPDGNTLGQWDTTGVRQNGDINAVRAELGVFGYLNQGKWHVKGYFYDSEKGIPRAIIRNVWTSEQRQWDRNAFVQGNFTKTLLPGLDVQASAKYANDYMRYFNPDTTLYYTDNRFTQQEVYLTATAQYSLSGLMQRHARRSSSALDALDWRVSAAADWTRAWLDATLAQFVYPRRNTGLIALATAVRWRWARLQASALGTRVTDRVTYPNTQTPSAPDTRAEWTPAVYASFRLLPREEWYLRAFYKRVFRMPTFNDLYYTDIGNINLRPEYTTQYDAGTQYDKTWPTGAVAALHLKADGYFNQVKDKIVAIPKGNSQYRWQMMNLGYVEITGVDANASVSFRIGGVLLSVSASYTYQRAIDLTDPSDNDSYYGTYGKQIAYIPRHSGSATASLTWRAWGLHYAFVYVGERYHSSANIRENYEPSWYTHDLALSRDFTFRRFGMRLSAEVNNLLNQQYDVILNYPMPGINGKMSVRFVL